MNVAAFMDDGRAGRLNQYKEPADDIDVNEFIVEKNFSISIMKMMMEVNVVSFDLFDTLIRRPFLRPEHLFKYYEERFNVRNFMDIRVQAEQVARRKLISKPDVTIGEIYEHLELEPERELDLEKAVIKTRAVGWKLLKDACKLKKRIAIISDSYFPKNFAVELLSSLNIDYDVFIISSDDQKAKFNATAFHDLLQITGEQPEAILHIGDNRKSDFEIPSALGLRACQLSDATLGKNRNLLQRASSDG